MSFFGTFMGCFPPNISAQGFSLLDVSKDEAQHVIKRWERQRAETTASGRDRSTGKAAILYASLSENIFML